MSTNNIKKIPLNLNKLNKKKIKKFNSDLINTANSESPKNIELNQINHTESNRNTINSNKKKKKVSFIDQLPFKQDIAQIIFINDKVSLNEDKLDSNKYLEYYQKQTTYITERIKKNNNDILALATNNNKDNEDIYKIKRPKKSLFNKREKEDKVKEQCSCSCIIF